MAKKYYGQNASAVGVPFAAPDMSNVMQLASQAGRNEAYADFLEDLFDLREKQAKEEAKVAKERAKASEEAAKQKASEEDGGSFLSKFADAGLGALDWTIDKISRPLYAVNNTAKYLQGQDDDVNESPGLLKAITGGSASGKNFFDWADDLDVGDIGGALKAAWEGFSGQEKVTGADLIKANAEDWAEGTPESKVFGNKIYQGVAGFGFDVANDPLSYMGAGLVTKPLKKMAERTIDDELAEDLAKQGLTRRDMHTNAEIDEFVSEGVIDDDWLIQPLTANDFKQFLQHTSAPQGQVIPKGLKWRERRAFERAYTVKGRHALIKPSDQAASTRRKAENLGRIANALSKPVEKLGDEAPGLKKIREYADEVKAQHSKLVDDAGNKAYKAALEKFDSAGLKFGDSIESVKYAKAASHARLTTLMGAARRQSSVQATVRMIEKAKQEGRKLTPAEEAKANELVSKNLVKSTNAELEESLKGIKDHPAVGPETVRSAWDLVEKYSSRDDSMRKLSRRAVHAFDGVDMADDNAVRRAQTARNNYNKAKEERQAILFKRALGVKAGLDNAINLDEADSARLTEINAELDLAKEALNKHATKGSPGMGVSHMDEVASKVGDSSPEGYKHMSREQVAKHIQKLQDERDNLWIGAMSKDMKFDDSIEAETEKRFQTWLREGRSRKRLINRDGMNNAQRLELLPEELKEMFTPVGDKALVPKIEHNGKTLNRNKRGGLSLKEFDRLFKEQHGIAVEGALRKLQLEEGNYITWSKTSNGKKEFVTRGEFIDWAKQYPEKLAYGFGIKIQEPGKAGFVTYEMMKRGKRDFELDDWEAAVRRYVESGDEEVNKTLQGLYDSKLKKQRPEREAALKDFDETPTQTKKNEIRAQVQDEMADVREGLDRSDLMLPEPSPEQIKDAGLALARQEWEDAAEAARTEARTKLLNDPNAQFALTNKLAKLKKEYEETVEAYNKGYTEAQDTRNLMAKRLQEEALLNAADNSIRNGRNAVRLSFGGAKLLDVPAPDAMFKAIEAFSKAPLIERAWDAWQKTFVPASKLEPEMNLARLRMQARTPEIIKHHVTELMSKFSQFKPAQRRAALAALRKGDSTSSLSKELLSEFDGLVKYLDGSTVIDGRSLTLGDVNAFLPSEFQLKAAAVGQHANSIVIRDGSDIIKHLRGVKPNSDPIKALWHMRVATEQAIAWQAFNSNMRKMFGVAREIPEKMGGKRTVAGEIIEQLHEGHHWRTVNQLGDQHYFDPDVADQIEKLIDMMKPGKRHAAEEYFDKALRTWKSTVTVYNPGYYVRNGIGESLMCLFDDMPPNYFRRARLVQKAFNPDETEEAIKAMNPFQKYESQAAKQGRHVATLLGGRKLDANEVWTLYNHAGLKSGFVSTEFEHAFPLAGTARATPVGQMARGLNDAVRKKGEGFEDYFRLAHFVYRLEKAPHGLKPEAAAEWAAEYVRKFHFDYTDFTPAEKTYMMRIFPFYKWTRKAAPLMLSMLMTKPGNVSLYPKAMTNLGYATGLDAGEDDNGFAPNYEGVVPQWMKDLYAYPMGGADEQGHSNFMNIATPALDIYKLLADPASSGVGMLNPMFKVPLELTTGSTLDPDFKTDLDSNAKIQDHLMRTTPQTSFLDKWGEAGNTNDETGKVDSPVTEPGAPIDEVLLSFLSGLGNYENSEYRQELAKRFDK